MCLCNLTQLSVDYWQSTSLNNFADPLWIVKFISRLFFPVWIISSDLLQRAEPFTSFISLLSYSHLLFHISTLLNSVISSSSWILSCMDPDTFNNLSLHFNILCQSFFNSSPILFEMICKSLIFNYFPVLCLRTVFGILLSREYKLWVWSHTNIIYTLFYTLILCGKNILNSMPARKMKMLWELQTLVTELAANTSLILKITD